jgi:Ca-activated chloride channel family protein
MNTRPGHHRLTRARWMLAALACVLGWALPTEGSAAGKTIIVLDASGSMWGAVDGRHKIVVAREAIAELLQRIPPDTELGLMAYGHRRKSDCADIELLIPPARVDRKAFLKVVNSLQPKGMTPLTDAVEKAAESLQYTTAPATVILVSDGIETCRRDPCELARKLAKAGVAFRAHVIAFDLTSKEADSFRCLADETGGLFLPAQDAASLAAALEVAVAEASAPPPPPPPPAAVPAATPMPSATVTATPAPLRPKATPPPLPAVPAITLQAPDAVVMGVTFEVAWTGKSDNGDRITIVPKGAADAEYGPMAYTNRGTPAEVRAPLQPGAYELRYWHLRSRTILARRPIEVQAATFTVAGPAEAQAGSEISVQWSGPNGGNDFVTIARAADPATTFNSNHVTSVRQGNPARLRALHEPGEFELRYVAGHGGKPVVLARAPIRLTAAEATLEAPGEAMGGSQVEVKFSGPNLPGDWITLVAKGATPTTATSHAVAKGKTGTVKVQAPELPGEYEVRYFARTARKILMAVPVRVTEAAAVLRAPAEVKAGASFAVEWTGPDGRLDFLAICPVDHAGTGYRDFPGSQYVSRGSPLTLTAPKAPGTYEVRYVTNVGKTILDRVPLKVTPP